VATWWVVYQRSFAHRRAVNSTTSNDYDISSSAPAQCSYTLLDIARVCDSQDRRIGMGAYPLVRRMARTTVLRFILDSCRFHVGRLCSSRKGWPLDESAQTTNREGGRPR